MSKLHLDKKIGIIGGGQLGKMMILEAKRMGFYIIILDPDPLCSAHSIADEHIIADFKDRIAIINLAKRCDVLTYELEHINVNALFEVENMGIAVYPTPKSLEIIQNKYKQNKELEKNNVSVPKFMSISSKEDVIKAADTFGLPLMAKSSLGGYDGRGNFLIATIEQSEEVFKILSGEVFVEEYIDFTIEISVLACRGSNGKVKVYPVAQNTHKNEILQETLVPANISDDIKDKAREIAAKTMEIFEGIGMFCIEMFVKKDGNVLVNEIAPRPHNSGHFSIEACITSQFANHIRAISGLPLGDVSLIKAACMHNILGEHGENGKAIIKNAEKALEISGVSLHIYGKKEVREKRKMGHITAIADTVENAQKAAKKAHKLIKIVAEN